MRYHRIFALLAGIWLFGIGSKFIYGFFAGYSMPLIPVLDLFIDWGPCALLGSYLIVSSISNKLVVTAVVKGPSNRPVVISAVTNRSSLAPQRKRIGYSSAAGLDLQDKEGA